MGKTLTSKTNYDSANDFSGIYRGYVVWNDDPGVHGRIKVFVPGVYDDKYSASPERLPWARPFSPSYGGGAGSDNTMLLNQETGWCSVPHVDSQVFVFFENSDINYPVYLGVAQSGEGWFSEHPNQHRFQTDNIRVRIEENPDDERSTTKFDSYTAKNTDLAKANLLRKYGAAKFDQTKGVVKDQKTRLDIEIEASDIQAVNLNIRGNVNLRIDGDWFVEHYGDYYEYREGDRYIKQKGNTYVDQLGTYRKVQDGNWSYELDGDSTIHHSGDHKIDRHGNYHEQNDADWSQVINGTVRKAIGESYATTVAKDYSLAIGGNRVDKTLGDWNSTTAGYIELDLGEKFEFLAEENISFHSKKGNIILQTDGQFELMDGKTITPEGFKNIGTKGNIILKSTFGNIGIFCEENKELADFAQKNIVAAWSPYFEYLTGEDCTDKKRAGELLEMNPTVGGFTKLMKELKDLKIYDGLPVFLPTKMIAQNPNIRAIENEDDLSWISNFRSENQKWTEIHDDAMWKIPAKLMGNISVETWSGDITIKTESTLGCAGNIDIVATEKGGTLPGYKTGTINIKNEAARRVYTDPRDLFLDSDFKNRKKIFTHATDKKIQSVLPIAADSILNRTIGNTLQFNGLTYKGFNEKNQLQISTNGHTGEMDTGYLETLMNLSNYDDPELGCPHCITDFLLGIPGVKELVWMNSNLADLPAPPHEYGGLKYNPEDPRNLRGTFNLSSGNLDKISIGDGHNIETGFSDRYLLNENFGGFTVRSSGARIIEAGGDTLTTSDKYWSNATVTEKCIHMEYPHDDYVPQTSQLFLENMKTFYAKNAENSIQFGNNITLAKNLTIPSKQESKQLETGFRYAGIMPNIAWSEGGSLSIKQNIFGNQVTDTETIDTRADIDYGVDFQRMWNLMAAQEANSVDNYIQLVEVNFYESDLYSKIVDDTISVTTISGGGSNFFQVSDFSPKMHVELSSAHDSYLKKIEYKNATYSEKLSRDHVGYAWWDLDGFVEDQFSLFPDVVTENVFNKNDTLYADSKFTAEIVSHDWEHATQKKYGNHEKSKCDLHKKYETVRKYGKTGRCPHAAENGKPSSFFEIPSHQNLWKHPLKGGVGDVITVKREASPTDAHFATLCTPCPWGQNIIDNITWNALTDIRTTESYTAKNNDLMAVTREATINESTTKWTGAINTKELEFNSDRVGKEAIEDDQYEYQLFAGNAIKTIFKGNQCYHNYVDEDTSGDKIKQGEYFNNIEVIQNGFPTNRMKFVNGTNTKYDPDPTTFPEQVQNLENEGIVNNEFTIYNGGTSTKIQAPVYSGADPIGAYNSLFINNGRYENTTPAINIVNDFILENGFNVLTGINMFSVENGEMLKNGSANIRLSNWRTQGNSQNQTENVNAVFTLNNARENQSLTMSDQMLENSVISSNLAMYSSQDMELASKQYLKNHSKFFKATHQTGELIYTGTEPFSTDGLTIKANNFCTEVPKNTEIKTNKLSVNSDSGEWLGKTLKVEANTVDIAKANISGTFNGMLTGSLSGYFEGLAVHNNSRAYRTIEIGKVDEVNPINPKRNQNQGHLQQRL